MSVDLTIFILKLLAIWFASSIALGLILGPLMRFGLHYEADDASVPLHDYQQKPNRL